MKRRGTAIMSLCHSRVAALAMAVFAVAGFAPRAEAQQLVSHRSDGGTDNWWDGNNPWYYHTWNNNQDRPDRTWQTANDVQIGHNNNRSMLLNGNDWYYIRTLNLQAGANQVRTFRNPSGSSAGLSMRGSGTVKIENNSSAWHTFGVQVGLDASVVEFNPVSGSMTFTNSIFLNANTLHVWGANGHTIQLDGSVSGTGGVWLRDNSTLHLTTSNSFTGTATVSAGTLRASVSQHALGASTNVTLAGGTLALAGSSGLSFSRNTFVTGNATIRSDRTVANNAGVTHTMGTLSIGAQTLTVNAGGNVNSGTAGITFGNTTFSASGPVFNVDTGALLTLGALQSTGNFTKQGAGRLELNTAANAARSSGTVTLTAGTLRLGNVADALGTTGVTISQSGGDLQLGRTGTINAYNTTITGNSTITPDRASGGGAQTLTLGTLTIGANTLTIARGSNFDAGAVAGLAFGTTTFSASGAVFDVASEVNLTLGALQSTGNFTKQGSGTITLGTAANAARTSGTVSLTAGTMRLGNIDNPLGTTGVTINQSGGDLQLGRSGNTMNAYNTAISGNATITPDRASSGGSNTNTLGTLNIGAHTLTVNKGSNVTAGNTAHLRFGATTLTGAATFDVGTEAALTFNSTVNNGGFLMTVQGAGNTTASGIISGSGGLTKAGAGNLTLTAANTHSGNTTVNAGTLVLSGSGSMANTPQIILGTGAGLDVSAPTTALSLAAGQSLRATATGANATATITVASSKNLTLSSGGLVFTALGSGATAPLTVAGTGGSLALNGAPVTVTTTAALTAGTYKLIAKSGSASVTGTPGALTVGGSALAAGQSAVLSVTNGELVMIVGAVPAAPTITSITAGNQQLSVAFTAGSDGGSTITDYKWSLDGTTYTLRAGTASPIVITGLTNGQSYTVRIRAVNAIGDGGVATGSPAIPVTTPAAPTISSISAGDRQLSVNFSAGSDGGSAITTYKYSTDGGSTFRTRSSGTTGTPLVITTLSSDGVTQLNNGTSYNVQILAVNAVGDGAATATTAAAPVASATAPLAPTITGITPGNGTLSVAFTPGSDGGAAITNYEFRTSTNGGTAWSAWTARSPAATTSPLLLSSLTNGTEHTVQIRAVNSVGSGTPSSSSAATPRTTAGAPTIGTITPGNGTLSVAFTAPADNGGAAITDYKWSVDGTSYTTRAGTASPIVITGLDNGTAYTVRIRAVNAAGDGTVATAGATATPSTTPAAPTITGITPGNAQLSVAFTAPGTGGSAITDYEYSTDGGTSFKSAATTSSPITITTVSASSASLANGTSYNVQIRARNANGVGTATSSTAAIPRTTPGAPTIGTITPGNGQLSVAFTAPASDGGSAITDYKWSVDGTNYTLREGTASPIVITGLDNGTAYTVSIRAVNVAGDGTVATAGASATPITTPTVTTGSASAVGSTAVTLGGNITSIGGSSATERGIFYSTVNGFADGAGTKVSATGTFATGAFTQRVTGLAKNTTYYFKAFAVNAAGTVYGTQGSFTTLNAPDGRNPQSNTNPTTSFLGESVDLNIRAWQAWNNTNRSFATVFGRFDNSDLTADTIQGSGRDPGSADADFFAATPRFAQTGTFYWAMRVSYGSGVNYFFDASRPDWLPLATTLPSAASLSIEVSPLNPPSGATATAANSTTINLSWTKGTSGVAKDTIIVRRASSAVASDPVQGTAYNASDSLGTGTVVYRGGATTFSDENLQAGTTYHYKLYAENWSYYSSGITASATTPGTPTITIGGSAANATASAFTTTYGTASTAQTFAIAGTSLTANITATAPTGFEVSSNGTTYGSTATFTQTSGSASGTLYVRLAATAAANGTYNSQSIALTSTGATQRNINTPSGGNSVSKATPSITAAPTASSSVIKGDKLTNGLLSGGTASTAGTFTFNDTTSEQTASGNKAVTFTPTDTTNFNTASTNVNVAVDPVPDPTNVGATASGTTSIALTHNLTSSKNVMIVRRAGSAVTFTPADDTTYSDGQDVGSGQTVVRGSLAANTSSDTGLSPSTTYHYKIFSENWGWYSPGVATSATTSTPPPTISVSGSPAAMSTTYGSPSSPSSFTVSGSNLTANLTVTAPSGFEVSTTSGSGYGASVSLTPSSGTVSSTTIHVRLKSNASPGSNSGNVTAASTGATSQTVAVSGTVNVPSMSMTIASPAGTMNADYTTSKLYADEVSGTTNNVTITLNTGNSNAAEVEVWTNLNNRDRADNDANSDGIPDGIIPPDPPTDKPVGYVSGVYPSNGYFQAHPMSGSGGTYTLTLNANKTGAYRLTARYRVSGGDWVWYNLGGKRDHAITVAPVLARQMQVYEINVLNINATGDTFATRSTFESLTNSANGRVNLDYLRNLGVNTLWFQPIHPNGVEGREPSGGWSNSLTPPYDPGSPYAVKNFFEVMEIMSANYNGGSSVGANRAAAMSAFTNFVTAADAKGVHVMLDAPFNHTAHDVELSSKGLELLAAAGVSTNGWSATDKIKDREARFFSRNDGSNAYAGPASSAANAAVAPDRNDFGKWRDVLDVFFGRYSSLVEGNPSGGAALNRYKNEEDTMNYGDLTGGANSAGAVTRAVWEYFARYVPYWLEQTGLPAGSSVSDQATKGVDGLRADFGQGMPPQFWEYVINVAREHKWSFVFMSESLDGGEVTYRSNRHFDILNENIVFPWQSASTTAAHRTIFEDRRNAYGQGLVLLNNTSHDEAGYADPWQAFLRYAVGSTIDGAPMIMYGQEIGTGASLSFNHYELNFGKSIPHFKRYNSMQPQWTAWENNAVGARNLFPAYSGVGLAREFSPALRSANRWFLNPINSVDPDQQIFAVAKYETANASPSTSDVVLAFVNISRSNNVANTFGIPSALGTLLGLESNKRYNVKNIAAYLGPNNEYPTRRSQFLWETPRTGADILQNGIYVSLNGVPTTDAGWVTNPHEPQYLKVYAAPGVTTSGTPSAITTAYGSASTNTSFSFSATDVHDGLTITAPAGFQISTNASSGFASSLNLSDTGTIGSTTLFARLAATNPIGSYAGNITFSSPGGTNTTVALPSSTVSAKVLTGSFTASSKTYDRTTAATVTGRSLDGVVGSEAVTLSGGTATFADANVGTGKTVTLTGATLSGAAAGNYTLGSVSTTTADITAKAVTGSFTAANKTFDGTTAATVTGRSLSGVIDPDVVTLDGGTATFADATVGTGKTVSLTGATLAGAAAGNYNLTSVSTTTANISAAAPGAPAITSVTPGNGTLSVAFTAPASTGGVSLANYEFSTNGGSSWTARSPAATGSPLVISGLSNGTSYDVQIRAVNAAGAGAASSTSTATPRTSPTVTTGAATSVAQTTATLGGNITATGGVNATVRGVEYSTSNNFAAGTGTRVTASGDFGTGAFTVNVAGLTANTTYYFRAFATNAAGTSYGDQATFTTVVNAPAAPNTPTFASVSGTGFTVNWNSVTDAASYRLDVATSSGFGSGTFVGSFEDFTVATTSQAVTGLTPGRTYYVRVRAVNAAGTSASSQTGTQTTTGLSAPAVQAASAIGNTSFTANWSAVSGATGYRVDVSAYENFEVEVFGASTNVVGWNFNADSLTATSGLAANTSNTLATEGRANTIGFVNRVTGNRAASVSGWDSGSGSKAWVVSFNASGRGNLTVSSVQRSSGTGPKDFKVQYRIGAGGAWTDVPSAAVTVADNYTTGVLNAVPLPAEINNQSEVYLRWVMTSNLQVTQTTPGTVVASGGTSAIDDIMIEGAEYSVEPSFVTGYEDREVQGGATTSVAVTGLNEFGAYYYRVRATNEYSTSPDSELGEATTTGSLPIAAWEVTGQSNYGDSPLTAATADNGVAVGGLTRGSGIGASGGSPASNAWGGRDFSNATDKAAAITANEFVTFTVTPNAQRTLSLSTIKPYNIRRSGTSPTTGQWQYSIGSGEFVDIGSAITWGGVTTAVGNAQSEISLSSISALQNVGAGTTVTLRLVLWGATASTGTWYINNIAGNDLAVAGTVSVVQPTITGAATTSAFSTTYGTASAAQSFAVSGSNLTANLVATAPTGFEVSADGSTWGSTATFTPVDGAVSGTVSVRLRANASAGSYNNAVIALSSTGATNVNITTPSSGNNVAQKAVTITGLTAADKYFDGTTSVAVSGTPIYSGLVNSESFNVTGSVTWAFADANAGNSKPLTRTGAFNTPSANYILTQPALTASILALQSLTDAGAKFTETNGVYTVVNSNNETIAGATFTYLYTGRTNGVTNLNRNYAFITYSNSNAPTQPGFYKVTATAGGSYTGTLSEDYAITGPLALPSNTFLNVTRTAGMATNTFNRTAIMSNVQHISTNFTVLTGPAGLNWTSVQSGLSTLPGPITNNNTVTIVNSNALRLVPASSNSTSDTFGVTLSDGRTAIAFPVIATTTNAAARPTLTATAVMDSTNGMQKVVFLTRPGRTINVSFMDGNGVMRPITTTNVSFISPTNQPTTNQLTGDNQTYHKPVNFTPANGILELMVQPGVQFFQGRTNSAPTQ